MQGTKNDLKALIKDMNRNKKLSVIEISDYEDISGCNKYHKVFVNLKRNRKRKSIYENKEMQSGDD